MRLKHFSMSLAIGAMLITNLTQASQPHRLAFSERMGVEYLALTDSTGVWCQPEIVIQVFGKSPGFSQSEQFVTMTQRVGELAMTDCPKAQSAKISVFEGGGNAPVWQGRASASDGWRPVAGGAVQSANLDTCSPRDLDCKERGNTKTSGGQGQAPGTSVQTVGSIAELIKQVELIQAQAKTTPSSSQPLNPMAVAGLPPGFPRTPSARISGPNYAGKDLSREDLRNQKLDGANFTDANLSNANLAGASMQQAIFKGANMHFATLSGANLTEADFRGAVFPLWLGNSQATLVGANFEGMDLKGTDFWFSNMTGANLRNTSNFGAIGGANMSQTDLRGANLLSARPGSGDLSRLNLKGAIYDDATVFPPVINPEKLGAIKVQGSAAKVDNFAGKDLSEQNYSFKKLDNANFSGATLQRTNFEGSSMKNANLQDADLQFANMGRVDLTGADFRGSRFGAFVQAAILRNANFENLDMMKANLYAADLSGANLRGTKNWGGIQSANFSNADFRGANLLTAWTSGGSNLAGANFKGAKYDGDTVFPRGFNPESAGMVKIN